MSERGNGNTKKYVVVVDGGGARKLDGAVKEALGVSWGKARDLVESGKIKVNGAVVTEGTRNVRNGAEIEVVMNAPRPNRSKIETDSIAYIDPHIVVVVKPSGISTVPFDESETDTLDERLRRMLEAKEKGGQKRGGRSPLGVVHRLDKETSGLLVFARTWLAKQSLSQQFRAHTVHRRYFAIVQGKARGGTIESHLVQNRGDGLRGSIERQKRPVPLAQGQRAVTHVEVEEELEGATLVSCRLETGRTHQIRVHLSESGHPVLGERVYIRHFEGDLLPAPRVMLHAAELGIVHPATNREMRWEEPPPPDFEETLARLKKR